MVVQELSEFVSNILVRWIRPICCFFVQYMTLLDKNTLPKYCIASNINKFNMLMIRKSETSFQKVAAYLYYAFKLPKEILDSLVSL